MCPVKTPVTDVHLGKSIHDQNIIPSVKTNPTMGNSSSKKSEKSKGEAFIASAKQHVEDELAKRMMLQREVQMAVNIAKARDTLHIFGSAYTLFLTGVATAKIAGKNLPHTVGIPIFAGGLFLGNLADMAYGNKFARINKEAEHILEHERARFVPFSQALFSKFYTEEEKAAFFNQGTAVGDLFPNSLYARHFVPRKNEASKQKTEE